MPFTVLNAAELLHGLEPRESELVAGMCSDRSYPAGATIFSRGDPGDSLYIVKEGLVRLCFVSEKGTETILHILKPDAVFGELLLSEEQRRLSAVAGTGVAVTAITKKDFEELLVSVPTIARNFIRILSRRLAKVEQDFAEFGHTWSYHRLANVLLQLADEHGLETARGTRIGIRLTHEDLAKLIGTTRETVTTQLNRFRRLGMVRREGRHLVLDRGKLSRFGRAA